MDDSLTRFWTDMVGRLTGPMTFRLFLQPTMASFYALRDGLKDAHAGRRAYFWAIFTQPGSTRQLLQEGWKSVGRVIALGAVMDGVYQAMVFRWLYPNELIVVVLLLAVIPYLLLRGPVNRLASLWMHSGKQSAP
jgi:hypothetical protein